MHLNLHKLVKNNKLNIIVKANSSKNKIVKWIPEKNALKIEIKTVPENNKANIEIIKFFSKLLKKNVKIVKGFTSKNKVLLI